MLSRAQIKYIRSLTHHKFRREYKAFVAEGGKIAVEWLSSGSHVNMIVATDVWAQRHAELLQKHATVEVCLVKEDVLESLTGLQTAGEVMLVLPIPETGPVPRSNEWYIALDNLQDPGNMGAIIRIADWFGIRHILCSPGCVDAYNPKVVQSAMGSHLRVNIFETDLPAFLSASHLPILAATLDGDSVYNMHRLEAGILMIGNESKGISGEVLRAATQKITIPRKGGAESLNAAVSAGILCSLLVPC